MPLLLPYPPAERGSGLGLSLFPFLVLILTILAARRGVPGWPRIIFVLTALAVTGVTFFSSRLG